MNEDVLNTVLLHIDAYNRRDIEQLLHGIARDAVFKAGGSIAVGRDNIHTLFASAFAAPWHSTLHITNAVVQNGTASCEMVETVQSERQRRHSELVGIYTVRGQEIVRVRLYRDPEA
ncbi:MAG TPA: nuclear transport factor 2 family protein [Euzebyales bacterium]|nr:nuclear transport factor 2 family protein [Euzebyales bacterium]